MSESVQSTGAPIIPDNLFPIDDLPTLLKHKEDIDLAGGVVKKIKAYSQSIYLGGGLHNQTAQIRAALETFRKLTTKVMLTPNDFGVLLNNEPDDYCFLDDDNGMNKPQTQFFWTPVEDALHRSIDMSGLNDRFNR